MPDRPLLEVRDLTVHFALREGLLQRRRGAVQALNGVSLELARGDVFGLVGESGCGKTTLGRAVVGLAPVLRGEIRLDGESLIGLTGRAAREPLTARTGRPSANVHPEGSEAHAPRSR